MIHTSIFYSCISPALVLIHTDHEGHGQEVVPGHGMVEQKNTEIQKQDFKDSFTKRTALREKIRKQASYSLSHFSFPAPAKLH